AGPPKHNSEINKSVRRALSFRAHYGIEGLEDALQRGPEELRHRIDILAAHAEDQRAVSLLIAVEAEAETAELATDAHEPFLVLRAIDADVRLDRIGGRFLLFLAAGTVRLADRDEELGRRAVEDLVVSTDDVRINARKRGVHLDRRALELFEQVHLVDERVSRDAHGIDGERTGSEHF